MTNEHDNVLDARESVALDADLENFLKEVNWRDEAIEDNIFDPTQPDIPVCYALECNGIPFAPLGGICGLNGQPGHGKTMTFSMIIAAVLRGQYCSFRCPLDPATTSVLYIDTEMELVNTQRTVRRVYDMVGWEQRTEQPRLHTVVLREVADAETRWRKILKAIWQYKPRVVLLDGLIDVVKDFNDNKECQDRIYQCMSVASHYNISLWCLLHLNPGSEKAVGHLGSFLERKATDIFISSLDDVNSEFKIKHTKHRLIKIKEIRFKVEDDEHHYGHPVMLDSTETPAANVLTDKERKALELREKVLEAVKGLQWTLGGLTYTEFESGLKAQGITSNRKLSDYIKLSQDYRFVSHDDQRKRYYYVYNDNQQIDNQTTIGYDEGAPF